ncbi:MAG: polysaccharide deacetylase family protein [Pseudomonadota bacterium]
MSAGPSEPFRDLRRALDRLAAAGRTARFWLRDDDATGPGPALDRLLGPAGAAGIPVTLAVIPRPAAEALARRLGAERRIEVAVHGWSHRNHAPAGRKTAELGDDRPAPVVLGELAEGRARLRALFPGQAVPLLVPPWNRIAPGVVAGLRGAGFQAVSTFGPEPAGAPLPHVNTHVDLIDWRGTRGGRPPQALIGEILARLGAHPAGRAPAPAFVGVLTHHLVHDEAAQDFLLRLFAATDHPAARWVTFGEALAAQTTIA